MKKEDIKNVAIYLRKSRDSIEDDDVLKNHRQTLVAYADKMSWDYTIYEEVKSGASMNGREEMQRMLNDVEAEIFNGVLVMDYDRLSRAGSREFGMIIDILSWSDTFIITLDKIYDLDDENDLMMLGFLSTLGKREHSLIINRFQQGKRAATAAGRFINGQPTFPYVKKKEIITQNGKEEMRTTIDVDEVKEPIYLLMKELYLTKRIGFEAIAIELNSRGYKSPKGGNWSAKTIERIMLSEMHLGIITYGKTKVKTRNGKSKITKVDDCDIVRGNGNFKKLKTEEEHQRILAIKGNRAKVPSRSKQGVFPTSGLMKCKKCGYTIRYSPGRLEKKTNRVFQFIKCGRLNPIGQKCYQKGVKFTDDLLEAIVNQILDHWISPESICVNEENNKIKDMISNRMKITEQQIENTELQFQRVIIAYENNVYNLDMLTERKLEYDKNIEKLKNERKHLMEEFNGHNNLSENEMLERLDHFRKQWSYKLTNKEMNNLLHTIVKVIYYDRNGNEVTFEIVYK